MPEQRFSRNAFPLNPKGNEIGALSKSDFAPMLNATPNIVLSATPEVL